MKKNLINIIRALFAIILMGVGVHWFYQSSLGWYGEGFPILSIGEKGKDVFSGVLFSIGFIGYGVWEIYRLIKESKT